MSSRFLSVLSTFLVFALFLGSVSAEEADKTRVGGETIDRTIQLRTHSIFAPYIDQDLQNRWWDFGADAYINTNKHIRLTRNKPSQMGWLWSRLGLSASSYVIEVEFKVSGDSSHLYGDGMAIWLTSERKQEGPVFGNKDKFNGLGIFLDTYANGHHGYSFPRINTMLGDGKTSYDYADDGDKQSLGGCSANFRRTNVATKLRITYIKDKFLDGKIQYKAWDDWQDCFHVKNVTLPPQPYLGVTAMTGDVSDAHDVITISTWSAIMQREEKPQPKKKGGIFNKNRDPNAEDDGSMFGLLLKVFLVGGVCAGGWYGYKEYQRRQMYGGGGNYGGLGGGYGGYSSNKRAF